MADRRIGQKDEIAIMRPPCMDVLRKREQKLTLLSDCLMPRRTPKLWNPQEGFICNVS